MIDKKNKRLLIVGGTGFIGTHLARYALNLGFDCSILSLKKPKIDDRVQNIKYLTTDLLDRQDVAAAIDNLSFEYVINLGGYIDHTIYSRGGRKLIDVHFFGLLNLIDALDWSVLKRFVQVGSSDEYGGMPAPQREDMREQPISPYSFAKVASTHFLQMLFRTERFPAVTARLFLVYGEGQKSDRLIPQIILGCLSGREFNVSEGQQRRDLCHVDDIARGLILLLTAEDTVGRVVNLASGKPIPIREVIETVRNMVGQGEPLYGALPYRKAENMELFSDIENMQMIMDWQPEITLADGLRKTINYFQANKTKC